MGILRMTYLKSLKSVLQHPNNRGDEIGTLTRLIWWKINQVYIKVPAVVKVAPGVNMVCYPDSSFGGLVVYTKLPEYYEMNYFMKNIKRNSIVVDVGANIGIYSLLAASRITRGRVYSFEVNQQALRRFRENVAINNFSRKIVIHDKLISDKKGYEKYVDDSTSETSHILRDGEGGITRKISSISLDSFMQSENIQGIDMFKIDVEGAEYKALRGLRKSLIERRVDRIIIEINKRIVGYGSTQREIFDFFEEHGYCGYIFSKNGHLTKFSSKGLVDNVSRNYVFLKSGLKK